MEIILKKDIKGLGFNNERIKVKDGYARNYLIPKGYAILATPSNIKVIEEELKQKAFKEEKIVKEAETLAKAVDNITVKIGAKASETGKIFGSVNTIQIAEAIKNQYNFDIDRKKIIVDGEAIKNIGSYTAKIVFYKKIEAEIKLEVIAE
ncbi:MAG: 50S ribosomal protein L9 [Bacteroidales bacterium]|nr:50S ribosomal protein L9 [Bacteroidales bacterium]